MKKIYLQFITLLFGITLNAQVNLILNAPQFNNATTSARAPNGQSGHANLRGVFHITQAEMTAINPTTAITSFGFNYNSGVSPSAVTGSIIVYFENSNDPSNLKSTTYTTAIQGMTTVYNNTMTIPVSAGVTTLDLTLPSAFSYTGGSLYVAYEWVCNGPYATTAAVYQANNSIANSGMTVASATANVPGTTLGLTAFRPAFRFGSVNTTTNDVSVNYISTPAFLATINGTSHAVQALIRNNSNTVLTNIPVSLNVTGAVTFANTFTVVNLPAGSSTSVTFAPFPITSGLTGINNMSVTVPNDQNNTNNLKTWTQTLTCNTQALGPDMTTVTFSNGVGFNTASGLLLNRMRFAGTNTLISTDISISTPTTNLGNNVYAVITNSVGTILATSNTLTIANANLGVYNNFTFVPTQVIANTDYYLGLAQPSNAVGYFPVASFTSATIVTPSLTLYSSVITGGVPVAQNPSLGFLGIKANLQGTCAVLNPTANFSSPSQVCTNSSATFTNTSVNATTYTWAATNASPATSTNVNASFTFTTQGTQTVTLLASNGTTNSIVAYTISVATSPTLSVTSPSAVCAGNSATLTASGASSYTWNPGSTIASSIVVTPMSSQTYSVVGANGSCITNTTVALNYIPQPTLVVSASSTSVCSGSQTTLTVNGANTYTWMPGNLNGVVAIVNPTVNTTYTVTGAVSSCSTSSTIAISTLSLPVITVQSNASVVCTGNTVNITATGAQTYTWNTGANASTIAVSPTITTSYTVTGTGANSCVKNTVFTQSVSTCAGITTIDLDKATTLSPNPTSNYFNIELAGSFNYSVYDMLGKKIISQINNTNQAKINVSNYVKGIYFVKIEKENTSVTKKLIVE